jgi:hypothetical protein
MAKKTQPQPEQKAPEAPVQDENEITQFEADLPDPALAARAAAFKAAKKTVARDLSADEIEDKRRPLIEAMKKARAEDDALAAEARAKALEAAQGEASQAQPEPVTMTEEEKAAKRKAEDEERAALNAKIVASRAQSFKE